MKEPKNNLFQGFAQALAAAAGMPGFVSALIFVAVGVLVIVAASFFAAGTMSMLISLAGMFISYSGFEKIGSLIQMVQEDPEDQEEERNQ